MKPGRPARIKGSRRRRRYATEGRRNGLRNRGHWQQGDAWWENGIRVLEA
jgi:hypothetical protein